jgi:hypothetical protein
MLRYEKNINAKKVNIFAQLFQIVGIYILKDFNACENRENLCKMFYCLFISVLSLEIQLSRRGGLGSINRFSSATFVCMSQAKTWVSNTIYRGLFVCSVVGGMMWLFICWYWWNCWPSLIKLSFHSYLFLQWISYTIVNSWLSTGFATRVRWQGH